LLILLVLLAWLAALDDFRNWLIRKQRKWPVIDRFAKVSRGESRRRRSLCRLKQSAAADAHPPAACPRQLRPQLRGRPEQRRRCPSA
jgi:hypothetical protein